MWFECVWNYGFDRCFGGKVERRRWGGGGVSIRWGWVWGLFMSDRVSELEVFEMVIGWEVDCENDRLGGCRID